MRGEAQTRVGVADAQDIAGDAPAFGAEEFQAAVARLNTELVRILRLAEIQEKFRSQGQSPVPSTAEQFASLLQSESVRYSKVVREAGIKAE